MNYDELNSAWDNMPSLKRMSTEQLADRICYIRELHDTLPYDEWERDWAAELDAANAELNTRTIII